MVAVVAEWRHRGRHSDRSMVGQRRHNGGTRKAEASLKLIHNVHNSTHFLWCDQWPTTVHPFCEHGGVCVPPPCLLWATSEQPISSASFVRLFWTCSNLTSRRPWRPWRCLNVVCNTIERPRQPFGLLSAFNGDLASFVVAQGRHQGRSPCVKVVLMMTKSTTQECTFAGAITLLLLWPPRCQMTNRLLKQNFWKILQFRFWNVRDAAFNGWKQNFCKF